MTFHDFDTQIDDANDAATFFLEEQVAKLFCLSNTFGDGFETAIQSRLSRVNAQRLHVLISEDDAYDNSHPVLHLIHHKAAPALRRAVLKAKSREEAKALATKTIDIAAAKVTEMLSSEAKMGGKVIQFPGRGRVAND